jgi:hypothetical protein
MAPGDIPQAKEQPLAQEAAMNIRKLLGILRITLALHCTQPHHSQQKVGGHMTLFSFFREA